MSFPWRPILSATGFTEYYFDAQSGRVCSSKIHREAVESCIGAGNVKRLIYTASVVAASPMKQDGTGFKHSIDESCWTPIGSFLYSNDSSELRLPIIARNTFHNLSFLKGREIFWCSTKLEEHGFEYKHGVKKILENSLKCAQEMGQF